jgi:formylglycine-generating enzyme required for sulfatase activity
MKNVLVALLVSMVLFCCSKSPTEPEKVNQPTSTVKGYVYVTGTIMPISGVVVSIGSIYYTTSINGYYELNNIILGSQTITATISSYNYYSQTIKVKNGINNHTIYLTVSVQTTNIHGNVRNSLHQGIQGAWVRIDSLKQQTDANGYYQFPTVYQGQKTIEVKANGYQLFSQNIYLAQSDYQYDVSLSELPIPEMIFIPAGSFIMGGSVYFDEMPVHSVNLNAFYIGKYEIANGQYCMFLNEMGNRSEGGVEWLFISNSSCQIELVGGVYRPKAGEENNPVVDVSWYGAKAYCDWLTSRTEHIYRLPTEAEWEYACRAGSTTDYCFGNDFSSLGNYAWFYDNAGGGCHPVGQKLPNLWGLYDMHGNVWEWCYDWYSIIYYQYCIDNNIANNPQGPSSGIYRVLRGGGWHSSSHYLRSAYRNYYYAYPLYRGGNIGFRCVQDH